MYGIFKKTVGKWEQMCYHKKEVNGMDEQQIQQTEEQPYVPRPAWQVWAARVALVVFLIGLVLYYCNIYGAVK